MENLKKSMQPQKVSTLDLAFGANLDRLLPHFQDIPDEFKDYLNPWNRINSEWFSNGLDPDLIELKEGIDQCKALLHLQVIMGSYSTNPDHKIAGCAYLMSQWFNLKST